MLKSLSMHFILFIALITSNANAAPRYITIADNTDRIRSVFEDLKVINDSIPYFQNRKNDKKNADPELESAVIDSMYDLQNFFSNTDKGDKTFDQTFDEIRKNLTEREVEEILRQSGMFNEIVDPILGGSYQRIEKVPGYSTHSNGKDKLWRAYLATILAFQLEVIRYMQNLMNTYTNLGVTTLISRSDEEITLKPLSKALRLAGQEVADLKRRLQDIKDLS